MTKFNNKTMTYSEAVGLARQVIAERGADFQYVTDEDKATHNNGCTYVPLSDPRNPLVKTNGKAGSGAKVTGCIVGEIASKSNRMTDHLAGSTLTIGAMGSSAFPMTGKASAFLSHLQSHQDKGCSWGYALEAAMAHAERYYGGFE